jgi:hypothetical protein
VNLPDRRAGARTPRTRGGRRTATLTAPAFGPPATRDAPQACYLHIGTMKSGTTFLQQMLSHHQEALGADGVLFPGRGRYVQQINAVRDLLDLPGTVPPARLLGAWNDLRQEIAEWPGAASIVSVEHLSIAAPKRLPAIVESLAPATVHVVLTARDLARVLPSTWQENIQNGLTWTWPDFLASVMDLPGAEPTAGQRFWRQHDLARIARTWAGAVGSERVHLVTLPPPHAPRSLLWQRFCAAVGLNHARYPVEGVALRSNPGLDRAAAEMLRRVNATIGNGVDPKAKLRILKRGLAKDSLIELDQPFPIVLDSEGYAWTRRYSEQVISELSASGIDVVGDLDDLMPPERPDVPTDHLREPTDTEIADAAAAAAAALLDRLAEPAAHSRRPDRRRRRRELS